MLTAAKLLSDKLHLNEVPILGVSDLGNNTFRIDFAPNATQAERDEGLAIQAAYDPVGEVAAVEAADSQAKSDFTYLQSLITNELAWIVTARADIVTGKGVVTNPASTLAQTKQVINGLLDIVDRLLVEQDREMRAWRHLLRKID
jgi:hypothetical protein